MSKIFFIADTHFGHSNIITYENRPFTDVNEMDEVIIHKWNRDVSNSDVVYHCGDVSFYGKNKTQEIISQLNGYKILIKGNHDEKSNQWFLDVGFNEVSKYPIILNEWIIVQHAPPSYYNDAIPYFYIYGHVHSTEMYGCVTKQSACVCVERWNYSPVNLELISSMAKERQYESSICGNI